LKIFALLSLVASLCNLPFIASWLTLMFARQRLSPGFALALTWTAFLTSGYLGLFNLASVATGHGNFMTGIFGVVFVSIAYTYYRQLRS